MKKERNQIAGRIWTGLSAAMMYACLLLTISLIFMIFYYGSASLFPMEQGLKSALFGTFLMVLLMSLIVMPLGIIAAVYLSEYAKQGFLTRLVRLTLLNLAGVPSIIYGVVGLGFFVYALGGKIDTLFYSDDLPTPTFGTPGILWAACTLALLTLPVVIVATEDGLSRVPKSLRYGAYALGATRAEVVRKVVLPHASPAFLTAFILSVAHAAGEVAPLMLVGVVKSAQNLPIDDVFPYLHPEREFMHLGYRLFDLAVQQPVSVGQDAALFSTALMLLLLTVGFNFLAILVRATLRRHYQNIQGA